MKISDLLKKDLYMGVVIHAGLLWTALAVGYNSYKEFVRNSEPLTRAVRDSIKATFPWTILVLIVLYVLYSLGREKKHYCLSVKQYGAVIILYAVIVNLFFFPGETHILIVQNLAIICFSLLLLIWGVIKRFNVADTIDTQGWAEELTPPVIYKPLQRWLPRIIEYFREKPSVLFITGFMALIFVCAILLGLGQEKSAEVVANAAYFLLLLGVVTEVYQLIRHGDGYEKED